ncbi:MAG: FtsX-like permease family protein [Bacteroidota bacterium]
MIKKTPPKKALQFLRWFCRKDYLEEIEGNLMELFEREADEHPRKASWQFLWQVLLHLRPDYMKLFQNALIPTAMLKHSFLITYRGFLRNKFSFFINLIGLSTALGCALLILLWVQDELAVDTFHENNQDLYQLMNNLELSGDVRTMVFTPSLLAENLEKDFPEIEHGISLSEVNGLVLDQEKFKQVKGVHASENFFTALTYPLLKGNEATILRDKLSIGISEELAIQLYGSVDKAVGQAMPWRTFRFDTTFYVVGIFETPPSNASLQFDIVGSLDWLIDGDEDVAQWSDGYVSSLLVLGKGTDKPALAENIATYLQERSRWWDNSTFFLQKYSERYLYGDYQDGVVIGGRIEAIRLYALLAGVILLVACINFMNLATAQASRKLKEIGVKKTIGAERKSLVFQFITESILMTFLSAVLALGIVTLALPEFNAIVGKELALNLSFQNSLYLLGIILITGLLAGSYPAFYLSGLRPSSIFKRSSHRKGKELWIRKGLVVSQFAISIIFVVGVMVIGKQITFSSQKDLGYDRENVISFNLGANLQNPAQNSPEVFITELERISGVLSSANYASNLFGPKSLQTGYNWDVDDEQDDQYMFHAPMVGYDAIETLGMEMLEGRSFSEEFNDDRFNIIVNESALDMMKLDEPVGKVIDKFVGNGNEKRTIIGVVKDFQYGSIHEAVQPLVLRFRPGGRGVWVRIAKGTEANTLAQIQELYERIYPGYTFDFTFMDQAYQRLYDTEQRTATLTKYLSGLAIIISCLGLLGLATFMAESRSKEIGIRKILGASVGQIISLFSKEFLLLVGVSFLVAAPLSWVIMQRWLEGFAYSIDISVWMFVIAGMLAMGVAILAISSQSLKVAFINPVEFLRDE